MTRMLSVPTPEGIIRRALAFEAHRSRWRPIGSRVADLLECRFEELAHARDFARNRRQQRCGLVDLLRDAELLDVEQQRRQRLRATRPERARAAMRLGSDHRAVAFFYGAL